VNWIFIIPLLIAAATFLILVAEKWDVLRDRFRDINARVPQDRNRREVLKCISGFVAAPIVYWVQPYRFPSVFCMKLPWNSQIVKNKKTGKIHHLSVCKGHLPSVDNRDVVYFFDSYSSLHGSKKMVISNCLLNVACDEEKEAILLSSIKHSPTSTHLYKPLIKLWGRKKEYENIHVLLDSNIELLKAMAGRSVGNQRLMKKYTKAFLELEERKIVAKYHARISELS